MTLNQLVSFAADKTNFSNVKAYVDFARRFLDFLGKGGVHGTVLARNEGHYYFYQFKDDGDRKVSRPVNSQLMYAPQKANVLSRDFAAVMKHAKDIAADDVASRTIMRNSIYTIQQCIGVCLDAHPVSNNASKVAGDLFERLIRLLISGLAVDCKSGSIGIPIIVDGVEEFKMTYQHDLVITRDKHIKILGSVKTSSKDRMDKIFIDKFLYSKLTQTQTPHVALFLNDVQRKGIHPNFGINATFLPGHFKGYSVKLNPLDGVYYCDLRPNMQTDAFLKLQIHSIDRFFCTDLWEFLSRPHPIAAAEPTVLKAVQPEAEAEAS